MAAASSAAAVAPSSRLVLLCSLTSSFAPANAAASAVVWMLRFCACQAATSTARPATPRRMESAKAV
jgi:hypothetical protein